MNNVRKVDIVTSLFPPVMACDVTLINFLQTSYVTKSLFGHQLRIQLMDQQQCLQICKTFARNKNITTTYTVCHKDCFQNDLTKNFL